MPTEKDFISVIFFSSEKVLIYGVVPFQESDSFLEEAPLPGQISFLEDMFPEETSGTIYAPQATDCVLYDWKTQKKVKYQELKKGRENEI